jgi:hypothetical protein
MTRGIAAAAQVRLIGWCKKCRRQVDPDPGEMAAAPPIILAGASEGGRLYATDPATAEGTTKITGERTIASRLRSKNSIINGNIAENGGSWVYIKTKPPAAPFARRLPSPDDMTVIIAARGSIGATTSRLLTSSISTMWAARDPKRDFGNFEHARRGRGADPQGYRTRARWRHYRAPPVSRPFIPDDDD